MIKSVKYFFLHLVLAKHRGGLEKNYIILIFLKMTGHDDKSWNYWNLINKWAFDKKFEQFTCKSFVPMP